MTGLAGFHFGACVWTDRNESQECQVEGCKRYREHQAGRKESA